MLWTVPRNQLWLFMLWTVPRRHYWVWLFILWTVPRPQPWLFTLWTIPRKHRPELWLFMLWTVPRRRFCCAYSYSKQSGYSKFPAVTSKRNVKHNLSKDFYWFKFCTLLVEISLNWLDVECTAINFFFFFFFFWNSSKEFHIPPLPLAFHPSPEAPIRYINNTGKQKNDKSGASRPVPRLPNAHLQHVVSWPSTDVSLDIFFYFLAASRMQCLKQYRKAKKWQVRCKQTRT